MPKIIPSYVVPYFLLFLAFAANIYADTLSYPVSSELVVFDKNAVTTPLAESFYEAVSGNGPTTEWIIKAKENQPRLYIKIKSVGTSDNPEENLTKAIWYYILSNGEEKYIGIKYYPFKKGYLNNRININNLLRDTRDIVKILVEKQPFRNIQ